MTIKETLEIYLKDHIAVKKQDEVQIILLDTSSSTSAGYNSTGTVLGKGISIAQNLATSNRSGTNYLVTFDTFAKPMMPIKFSSNGTVMFPPGIRPQGSTRTHKGFEEILSSLNVINTKNKTTKIFVITDGQTDSSQMDLKRLDNEFRKRGVDIQIIAISNKVSNFDELSLKEQNELPGMDLVNIMRKIAWIYTPSNDIIPFKFANSVDLSTEVWRFLDLEFPKDSNDLSLPTLITKIINILLETNLDYTPTSIQDELQTLFKEIGMSLGLFYITFPNDFQEDLLKDLESKTGADLSDFIHYGFEITKQGIPDININCNQRMIALKDQKTSFLDANKNLEFNGSALRCPSISFDNGIVCFNVNPDTLTVSDSYSFDEHGNFFFSMEINEQNEQSIRQALRRYFGTKWGLNNYIHSSSVIFGVATQVLLYLLCCPEINLDNPYIEKLRNLAGVQISQKIQNPDKSYGDTFKELWLNKKLPLTHFSSKTTHADNYKDSFINPLGLPQTLWWAVMMMIIGNGLFNAQMNFYGATLQSEGIEPNETSLLAYIREKYSSNVTGTVKFLTINKRLSHIMLDYFSDGSHIYESLPHRIPSGSLCNTKTLYSLEERNKNGNKCIVCRQTLNDNQFRFIEVIHLDEYQSNNDPARFIKREARLNAIAQTPMRPRQSRESRQSMQPMQTRQSIEHRQPISNIPATVFRPTRSEFKLVVILMKGEVGSGKSTYALKIEQELKKEGFPIVLNQSVDQHCVKGCPIKVAIGNVINVLKDIPNILNYPDVKNSGKLAVIIDTCGEKNTGNNIFDYSFDDWEIHRVIPNYNESRIRQYLCWSLRNVLRRPLHSRDSNFWLNPISATVNTCMRVHRDKGVALFGDKFVQVTTKTDLFNILNDIESDANEYQEYLNTSMPIESCVKSLIDRIMHR